MITYSSIFLLKWCFTAFCDGETVVWFWTRVDKVNKLGVVDVILLTDEFDTLLDEEAPWSKLFSRICVLDGLVVKTVGTAVLIDVKFVVLVFRLLLVILSSLDSLWFTIMGGIWTLFPLFDDKGMLSPERKLVIKKSLQTKVWWKFFCGFCQEHCPKINNWNSML